MSDQLGDGLVELLRLRRVAVRAFRVVPVPVIAARDEGDPLPRCGRGAADGLTRSNVRVIPQIAGRRHDGHRHLRVGASTHEVSRHEHGPVHGKDGGRRVVRAIAHCHDRDAVLADGVAERERKLAVDRDPERDGAAPLHQVARHGCGVDHGHGALDVDVVRRQHDGDVWFRGREAPPELQHPSSGGAR